MLDSMRDAAGGFVAKVLMGLLVLSFAVWGFSDQFFGYGTGTLAQVGEAQVSAIDYNRALQQRIQALSRQIGQQVTLEQAREMGITERVLAELISEAALDNQARIYSLGVSDDRIASAIAQDPSFQGLDGKFDRIRFEAILRNIGMTDNDFVEDFRGQILRRQLANSVAGDVTVPSAMLSAYHRYQNEERAVSYIELTPNDIDPVGTPDAAAIQTYFDQNKARYRAPEYREIGFIVISPGTVADEAAISQEEITAAYQGRSSEFTSPERRNIRQIRFETEEEARAALSALGSDATFDALMLSRSLSNADTDLGLKSKAEIIDPKVADAAFGAESGVMVEVFDADFGPAVIEVSQIQPAVVQTLEEVSDRLRRDLARNRALDEINDLYDAIEDARAGGDTLEEAARKLNLEFSKSQGLARDGSTIDGQLPPYIPSQTAVIADAFASDVGVENNPLRADNDTWIFYEVLEVIPDRDRALAEVRDQVADDWRNEQISTGLGIKAEALLTRLKSGASLETMAAELDAEIKVAENLKRSATTPSTNAVALAFSGPQGHVANAESANAPGRILLRVDRVAAPAFQAGSPDAQALHAQLRQNLQTDLLQAYTSQLLQDNDPFVNNAVYAAVIGEGNDGL